MAKKSIGAVVREQHRREARDELISEMIETLAVLDTHPRYCDCDPCRVLRPAYQKGFADATDSGDVNLPPRRPPQRATA